MTERAELTPAGGRASRSPARSVVGGPTFDERRNTSRVWPVPPTALPAALRALARFRDQAPVHAAWIAAGAPTLTHAQHFRTFGEPYRPSSSSRRRR